MNLKSRLSQNLDAPEMPNPGADNMSLERHIGNVIRDLRLQQRLTIADVASQAHISRGMLSKIENGGISPSLTTLQAISRGLAVPITWLVSRFETECTAVFVKAGSDAVPNSKAARQQCKPLGHTDVNANGLLVEPHLISLTCETDVFPAAGHQGTVFLYLLQGEITYRHGASIYRMSPGDSLFFDATIQHGAEKPAQLPVRCLSIMTRRRDR